MQVNVILSYRLSGLLLHLYPRNGIALVCAGHAAKTADCGGYVNLLWRHHGFEGEVLEEGSEEDKELYASQSLTETRTLACQESTVQKSSVLHVSAISLSVICQSMGVMFATVCLKW